jgi:hypothetical protein
MLVRIDSGYFCAGVILTNNICTEAAPIVKYMIGWAKSRIVRYAQGKGWEIQIEERYGDGRSQLHTH